MRSAPGESKNRCSWVGVLLLLLAALGRAHAAGVPAGNEYLLGRKGIDPRTVATLMPGVVYDGSTADEVDDFLRKLPENSTARFANHIYETRGVWDNFLNSIESGFRLKSGWTLLGAGTNSVTGTIFRLVDVPVDQTGLYNFNAVFSTGRIGLYQPTQPRDRRPNVNQLTIRDMQIDCNYPALARMKGTEALQVAAIQVLGNRGIRISNVLVRNAASKKVNAVGLEYECFQVYTYNPWATNPPGDYVIDRVAIGEYHGGYTSAICVNGNASGIIQNCTVDLLSDRSQRYGLNFAGGLRRFRISHNTVRNTTRGINNDTEPVCQDIIISSNSLVRCRTGMLLCVTQNSRVIGNVISMEGAGAGVALRYHPELPNAQSGSCLITGNDISGPSGEGISLGFENDLSRTDRTLYWSTNNIIQNNVIVGEVQSKIPPPSVVPNVVRPGNRRHRAYYPPCTSGVERGNMAAVGFPSDVGPGSGCAYPDSKAVDTRNGYIARVRLAGTELDSRSDNGDQSGYTDFTTGYLPGVGLNKFKRNYFVQSADIRRGHIYNISVHTGALQYPRAAHFRVFIDWDQDGRFELDRELAAEGAGARAVHGQITVPAAGKLGSTRMRVILACGRVPAPDDVNRAWGEVEDYTISVVP
jgi:hypothetical protein